MEFILSSLNIITNWPRWYFGAILGTGFFTYYIREVVRVPLLACCKGSFRTFLEMYVPLLGEKFWPTPWCFESRAQTVLASLLRATLLPDLNYRREVLRLRDGGEVGLDWREDGCERDAPIIIMLPGLTGASQADYVKCLVMAANRVGVRVVVFNNRGLGGMQLKTPRTYCAANVEDLEDVVEHVHALNPNIPLGATGISMGGLILGNYLAQQSNACRVLRAAMVISVPWDVFKGTQSIEKPILNLLLNKHLVAGLCRTVQRIQGCIGQGPWDIKKVLQSRTIREFDENFTAKQFGFKDVNDYYSHATLHNKLDKIKVPLLCLSAADDPFQPLEAIPVSAANQSEFVAIVVTTRGGHIGFMEGLWPLSHEQYMCRLFSQYFSSVFSEAGSACLARVDST